jgi:adenine phosphoribosyltransferase
MTTDELVRVHVCPRLNSDSRAYKVLMNVAGDSRDFAIAPADLRRAADALAARLSPEEANADFIVGFAPGGIAIAVAMAYKLDTPAIIAYKTRLDLPDELTWAEPHCFTNTFYFYGVAHGMSVILVDDEVDSGNTLANATKALREAGAVGNGVASAVEVTHGGHSQGRERLAALGLNLRALRRVDVDAPQR